MADGLLWRKIYERPAMAARLDWSPSGRYLCHEGYKGQVVVVDEEKLTWVDVARPGPSTKFWIANSAWDHTRDAVGFNPSEGIFQLVDVQGEVIERSDEPPPYMRRTRPVFGGHALLEFGEDTKQNLVFKEADRTEIGRVALHQDVQDLVWSPDGGHLAVVFSGGVSVFVPGQLTRTEMPIGGRINALIWLDTARVAIGCADSNIRIFAWPDGVARSIRPPSWYESWNSQWDAMKVGVLEAHDEFVIGLAGPNVHGHFVSWDCEKLFVWDGSGSSVKLLASSSLEGSPQAGNIAMHPRRPLLAMVNGGLSLADLELPAPRDTSAPTVHAQSTLDIVLMRAGIVGAMVNSDSVSQAWDIETYGLHMPAAESLEIVRECKRIAGVVRLLMEDIEYALRHLWTHADGPSRVALEQLAGEPQFADDVLEVRSRLLRLLAQEIVNAPPTSRHWACIAFLAIGHLRMQEADLVDRQVLATDGLREKLDSELHQALIAVSLLQSRPSTASLVLARMHGARQAIDAVQRRHGTKGSLRLLSTVPNTLILKGGGAKGFAHIGAIMELRRRYRFDRFAGTSAGAILAVLLGAEFTDDELRAQFENTQFDKLICESWPRRVLNLLTGQGIYSGNGIQNWIGDLLMAKLDKKEPVLMSSLPLHTRVYSCQPHKPLHVFDSKVETAATASYAARCSLSIPLYFTSMEVNGVRAFDGGLRANYPVSEELEDAPNKPFFGVYLESTRSKDAGNSWLNDLMSTLFEARDRDLAVKHATRTVVINAAPIGMLDFKLTSTEKRFLLMSGRVAALHFLGKVQHVKLEDQHVIDKMTNDLTILRREVIRVRRRRLWQNRALCIAVLVAAGCVFWRI